MTQRHVCLLLASPPNNRGQSAGSPIAGHSCSRTVLLGDSVSVLVHTYGRPASASRVSRCWVCSDCTLEVVSCFISSKYWRSFFTTRSFLYTVDVCRQTRTHAELGNHSGVCGRTHSCASVKWLYGVVSVKTYLSSVEHVFTQFIIKITLEICFEPPSIEKKLSIKLIGI